MTPGCTCRDAGPSFVNAGITGDVRKAADERIAVLVLPKKLARLAGGDGPANAGTSKTAPPPNHETTRQHLLKEINTVSSPSLYRY